MKEHIRERDGWRERESGDGCALQDKFRGMERVGMGKERVATIFSPRPLMIWSKRVEQLGREERE